MRKMNFEMGPDDQAERIAAWALSVETPKKGWYNRLRDLFRQERFPHSFDILVARVLATKVWQRAHDSEVPETATEILDLPWQEGLPSLVTSHNVTRALGGLQIITTRHVTQLTERTLLLQKQFSRGSLKKVKEALQLVGLKLAEEPPPADD